MLHMLEVINVICNDLGFLLGFQWLLECCFRLIYFIYSEFQFLFLVCAWMVIIGYRMVKEMFL